MSITVINVAELTSEARDALAGALAVEKLWDHFDVCQGCTDHGVCDTGLALVEAINGTCNPLVAMVRVA